MSPHTIDKMRQEALLWLGTPHRNLMCQIWVGIDCVQFVLQIYKAAGLVPEGYQPPAYSPDEGLHNPSARIQEIVKGAFAVQEVPVSEVQDGDLLVFRNGQCSGHVGVFIDGSVWHSLGHLAVTCSPGKLWLHRVQTVFRIQTP